MFLHWITFILTYPIIYLLSKLPFRVIYGISDVLNFFVYRIFKYRIKVVRSNIQIAFEHKTRPEQEAIIKSFYKHFCDVLVEMIKAFSMNRQEYDKRYKVLNHFEMQQLKDRSFILTMPHIANWEWANSITNLTDVPIYSIYSRLENPYFDRKIRSSRGKMGTIMTHTAETRAIIDQQESQKIPSVYGIISDQSPLKRKAKYWNTFFGKEVPMHTGAEELCRKYNMPMVFLDMNKVKRGHYEGHLEVLTANPQELKPFELTDIYMNRVRQAILEKPDLYLWTHRRFKHARN